MALPLIESDARYPPSGVRRDLTRCSNRPVSEPSSFRIPRPCGCIYRMRIRALPARNVTTLPAGSDLLDRLGQLVLQANPACVRWGSTTLQHAWQQRAAAVSVLRVPSSGTRYPARPCVADLAAGSVDDDLAFAGPLGVLLGCRLGLPLGLGPRSDVAVTGDLLSGLPGYLTRPVDSNCQPSCSPVSI